MTFEITVPAMGESINSGIVAEWRVKLQQNFLEGDVLLEIETDKVTIEIPAPHNGFLTDIRAASGQEVKIGEVLALGQQKKLSDPSDPNPVSKNSLNGQSPQQILSPELRRLAVEKNIPHKDLAGIRGTGRKGHITKADLLAFVKTFQQAAGSAVAAATRVGDATSTPASTPASTPTPTPTPTSKIIPMTPIRKRIAARLLEAQKNAAILTTFNEVDMSAIIEMRATYQNIFLQKYQIKLGFMSIFTKIVCNALQEFPALNAEIQADNIIYHPNCHIGVAVGGPKGLVVPVIRFAEKLNHAEIEQEISNKIQAISSGTIAVKDLAGGTFTISNGGIYGSMLSTPILNPPQVGILGLHKIAKRAVVITDSISKKEEIQIRPVMYLALSYDHRLVDGKEAVTFLHRIKDMAEDPKRVWLAI